MKRTTQKSTKSSSYVYSDLSNVSPQVLPGIAVGADTYPWRDICASATAALTTFPSYLSLPSHFFSAEPFTVMQVDPRAPLHPDVLVTGGVDLVAQQEGGIYIWPVWHENIWCGMG
jgi:hypothetical protein